MMGIASEGFAQYNYRITNSATATPIDQGGPISRHWASDTYSFFVQDNWRVRPSLSLTFGLNYQLMMPITETNGQEVTPNVNMGQWFNQRAMDAAKGIPSNQDPVISFTPAGSFWGKTGLYSGQKRNFAPRIGFAWTPPAYGGKTVFRGGFGMYYDNFGPALALTYDATGTFGLSTTLENLQGVLTPATAPRITGMNSIPASILQPAPPSTFPVVYPPGSEAITNGIDQSLKTPYSYAANFSVQHELPGRITLDLAYVGHFGHRLLAYEDVAEPMNLVDPKSGISYFAAARQLSTLWRQGTPESSINASTVGPTAAYWQNMLVSQPSYTLCSTGGTTASLLVATYDVFGPGCNNLYNETSALYLIDLFGFPTAPVTGTNSFFNNQYSSLWDWRTIGHWNYNALQAGLHRQFSHGLLFGLNYTYSHSFDLESMSERGAQYLTSSIINSWDPNQMYGPSDYDLRHQINGYWVAELPFGRGKQVAGNVNSGVDAIIGGWQWGGTGRWTSGFPASIYMAYVWPTNWDEMGWADSTGQPTYLGKTIVNGTPNAFTNPTAASNAFNFAFPGESGNRNTIRGDGYMSFDMNLSKSWRIPRTEQQALQFRWSVYNVTNTARLDAYTLQDQVEGPGFGNYTEALNLHREMEFALIYKF